ncbi:hypothetical protein BC937DRAFT_93545 [Endogone sp. FLAS-F59071]|nr:hypothetical protein BC937DRAFT_93545 [Endogone sp. FLAS-F59071]|eukprot:RUS21136.1 hypothetical protein BC937DRAFT_93545 [Endogone sp. FLAS-F59071]
MACNVHQITTTDGARTPAHPDMSYITFTGPAASVQWEPKSCYFCNDADDIPMRTHGGLQCGKNGKLTIPFPKKPFCASGWKGLHFSNRLNHPVSEGHTVLPGFENIGYATLIKPNETIPEYSPFYLRLCTDVASNEGWNGGGGPSFYISPIQSTDLQLYLKNSALPVGLYSPWGLSMTYDTTTGQTFTSLGFQPEFTYTTNPQLWSKYLRDNKYMIEMECKSTVTGQKCDSWDEYWCDCTRCVCNGGTCYGCNGNTEPSNVPTCHAVVTSNLTRVTAVIRYKN